MATIYQEIAHIARLLKQDKEAQIINWQIGGAISPKVRKQIKTFQRTLKNSLQSLNSIKDFYIKSFFYDTKEDTLILYTRIMKQETCIKCRVSTKKKTRRSNVVSFEQQYEFIADPVPVSYSIKKLLTACLNYWIPSENSSINFKAINLMPNWRRNQ